jgi:hypothetical protein
VLLLLSHLISSLVQTDYVESNKKKRGDSSVCVYNEKGQKIIKNEPKKEEEKYFFSTQRWSFFRSLFSRVN